MTRLTMSLGSKEQLTPGISGENFLAETRAEEENDQTGGDPIHGQHQPADAQNARRELRIVELETREAPPGSAGVSPARFLWRRLRIRRRDAGAPSGCWGEGFF